MQSSKEPQLAREPLVPDPWRKGSRTHLDARTGIRTPPSRVKACNATYWAIQSALPIYLDIYLCVCESVSFLCYLPFLHSLVVHISTWLLRSVYYVSFTCNLLLCREDDTLCFWTTSPIWAGEVQHRCYWLPWWITLFIVLLLIVTPMKVLWPKTWWLI